MGAVGFLEPNIRIPFRPEGRSGTGRRPGLPREEAKGSRVCVDAGLAAAALLSLVGGVVFDVAA